MKVDLPNKPPVLKRALSLPLLVLYGLGVTIGAGIFALIGEVLGIAGDAMPAAFLLAGLVAGLTGVSYAFLVQIYPLAGGEAVFARRALGKLAGIAVGLGVVFTGIVSSAVITLAFAGYISHIFSLPQAFLVFALLLCLCGLSIWGIKQSVVFAAAITLIEFLVLLLVAIYGLPQIKMEALVNSFAFLGNGSSVGFGAVLGAALVAFFAFIGFEDIENLAEETQNPKRTAPMAIFLTLGITISIYMILALIAVSAPDRNAIVASGAPMAVLYEQISGHSGTWLAAVAAIAMINGILVQMIMVARVLYGMANEGLLPQLFAYVSPKTATPVYATVLTGLAIFVLCLFFPLVTMAKTTSVLTLLVFSVVNLSFFVLARRHEKRWFRIFSLWGVMAAGLSMALLAATLVN